MNLAATQALFWSLIRREENAGPADASAFVSRGNLTGRQRVEVYADMYWWRQIDALREDFPRLVKLLGDEEFYAVACDFLRDHPSDNPSLAVLGARLPSHLADQKALPRPDVVDLARLEWARCEVFFESSSEVAPADELASLGNNTQQARLQLVPALRLLTLEHAVDDLWRAPEADQQPAAPVARPEMLAVWRSGHEVFHVSLKATETAALRAALEGASLDQICQAFVSEANPAAAAFQALSSWFTEGWVSCVHVPVIPDRDDSG